LQACLDPELVAPLDGITEATGGGFSLRDIPATRAMLEAMLAAVKAEVPPLAGVTAEDRWAPSEAVDVRVPVRIYRPLRVADPLPALIWMHPGGYVIGSIELDDLMARRLAVDVGCAVISVEYRLAPEHPFPAPLDDCYGVFRWAAAEADALGIDAGRIALGGASAGGGLAAALALRARDRGELNACFQLLIYPAINDLNVAQVSASIPENLFWSRENALIGWRAYLGRLADGSRIPEHAAAFRAERLAGLPPAYLAAGALDMFVPDMLTYGSRLMDDGIATELHIYPGAFHAFDAFAPDAAVTNRFLTDRNAALRRAFAC
jgi:acetyl esterase/lipase